MNQPERPNLSLAERAWRIRRNALRMGAVRTAGWRVGGLAEFGGRRPPLQGDFRNEIKLIFPGEGFGMLSA